MRRSFSSTWNARWSETGAAILQVSFVIRPQQTLGQLLYVLHMRSGHVHYYPVCFRASLLPREP